MRLKLKINHQEFIIHQTKDHIHVDEIILNQLKPLMEFDLEPAKATSLLIKEEENFFAKIKEEHLHGTINPWTDGVKAHSTLDNSFFDGMLRAPFSGKVTKIILRKNLKVEVEAPLMVVESMKMEYEITSPVAARVEKILVSLGDQVFKDQILAILKKG